MTESDSRESVVTSSQPEALSAKRAVSTASSLAQLALGSFATFSGLLYAMGYLLTIGQMRMLGVGSVDISNQEILLKVIFIPLLSVICAVFALLTLEGLLVAAALALTCLSAKRLGLYRIEGVPMRGVGGLMVQWFGPLVAVMIVSLYANYLAFTVLGQSDLLLKYPSVTTVSDTEAAPLSFLLSQYPLKDLLKLKSSEIAGRQIYGFQVLALVFCLAVLVGLRITAKYAEAGSRSRQQGAYVLLGIAALSVLMQFLNIPFLYGYLVMDTKFPAVETTSFPKENTSKYRPKDGSVRLLVLGTSKGQHIVYSLEHKQMWRGVSGADFLPAKQLPEDDPLVFANPLPRPEQIKSISGSQIDCDADETSLTEIPMESWIDVLSGLLPAQRYDDLANTSSDAEDYQANMDHFGSLAITTNTGEILPLDLYEVIDQSGDQQDFYLAFKLSPEGKQYVSDPDSQFAGRICRRCGDEFNLQAGRYYYGGNSLRLKQVLATDFSLKPAEENKGSEP